MKLAIFGATGKTGIEVTKQALEKKHQVILGWAKWRKDYRQYGL